MVMNIRLDKSITIREIDGEILVLDLRSEQVHEFNQTVSFIWNHYCGGLLPEEIAAELAAEFDVTEERAHRDVGDTLVRLRSLNLLEIGGSID